MTLLKKLETLAKKHTEIAQVIAERNNLRDELRRYTPHLTNIGDVPPGHFYSPIPSIPEVKKNEALLFKHVRELPGIDLREQAQIELLIKFADLYYQEMPFQPNKTDELRYNFENVMFSYGDATSLYCMIRHLRPRRIVEIGSGFSSAVSLDTNDIFFEGKIKFTFIEPNNERLLSLLTENDKVNHTIIKELVQNVDLAVFSELEGGDILFVDSSHVCKIGSDVNRIIFEILPELSPGVYIHFHDIFLPHDYPSQWIYEGCAWNEAYLLRAFLQYNSVFDVVLMNTFMGHFHEALLSERMPLFMRNPGASFWIRKNK